MTPCSDLPAPNKTVQGLIDPSYQISGVPFRLEQRTLRSGSPTPGSPNSISSCNTFGVAKDIRCETMGERAISLTRDGEPTDFESRAAQGLLSPSTARFGPPLRPGPQAPMPRSPTPPSAWSTDTSGVAERMTSRVGPGTYVAFMISKNVFDAAYPEDHPAHHEIKDLAMSQFVGLVSSSTVYQDESGRTAEELEIHYVSKFKPGISPEVGGHFVPIEDSVQNAHPPLKATTIFPWIGSKQWTTLGIRVKVGNFHHSSLRWQLVPEAMDAFKDNLAEDYKELEFAFLDMSPEAQGEIERFSFPHYAILCDVWLDIRMADAEKSPDDFMLEAESLEEILKRHGDVGQASQDRDGSTTDDDVSVIVIEGSEEIVIRKDDNDD